MEEEKLYRIGMFSKMNQVTIKTLRYYDDIGLLKPRFIDPDNGYRYYSAGQVGQLHQLLALKKIGFSIEEIQASTQGKAENNLLQHKKVQLLREIAEKTQMLSMIESYMQQDYLQTYHMVEKRLPEVIIASVRRTVNTYQELLTVVPEMGRLMEQAGCECRIPEYCFNIYHDQEYRESEIDYEICEAVTEMKADFGELKFKIIEEVPRAVCTMHRGAYENLPQAYAAILNYIEAHGFEIADLPRENYIDGIWNKESTEEWLTEIQIPVK
ncbi:MerR family transcriptional regulator [Enterococcus alishanensis]|uniref:MerR family transcriptional regulator n=1 Tax=Enterococcus alishanensis TaxID=1303817 RepID=A0ABS6TH83_9ENTE|nr:MerR family transcriptional regulator [Enterococcus alishanensis]MBV7392298.1 MerR family transcriptional regulator [Enterococcus alishanensis]